MLLGTGLRGPVIQGPDGAGGSFGQSITLAGDIDHDHYDDLLVGADGVTASAGRVYLFPGGRLWCRDHRDAPSRRPRSRRTLRQFDRFARAISPLGEGSVAMATHIAARCCSPRSPRWCQPRAPLPAIRATSFRADPTLHTTPRTIPRCANDLDCDDGVFCNGVERCMPGAAGANALGCIPPAGVACRATQVCNESAARCQSDCGRAPDADGDGHRAAECGGDDCDDSDANRFPGNAEVCDPSHDEDCALTTVGSTDMDHDGEIAQTCCRRRLGLRAFVWPRLR